MKKYLPGFLVVVFLVVSIVAWRGSFFGEIAKNVILLPDRQTASVAAVVSSPFHYTFRVDGILSESGKMNDSSSPYFWLNSGGQLFLSSGTGKTILGSLPQYSKWRLAYNISNPTDTDNGYHPQNIFRLITRSKWRNFTQEVYFEIAKLNMSASANRNASNGILLFNRYQNGDNLYYAGVRVDGTAVIKKKINGEYYTMAQKPFYDGAYNRDSNSNFIPTQKWIGLKNEVKTNPDNTVSVKLFIDKDKTGNWILAAEATDDGKSYGGAPILSEGYAGIRTDFMDVLFDDYRIVKI